MKTVVITGATSGIGLAVCMECLRAGYHVIGIGRTISKIEYAQKEMSKVNENGKYKFYKADLMQLEEVKRVGLLINSYLDDNCNGKLYGLINNAGCVRSWYTTNNYGYEQQFALNHLSSFSLTYYLLEKIIKAKGIIIMTSSKSHHNTKMRWNDLMFETRYHPLKAYKQSKLANLLFAYSLNEKYNQQEIRAYGVDPGLVNTDIGLKDTGFLVRFIWNIRRRSGTTADVPAKTYLFLLNQNNCSQQLYFKNSKPQKYSRMVNKNEAKKLFEISEKLCGIRYEVKR